MSKALPNTVTHLDIIKTIAVVFMMIDHIGVYFLEALPVLQDWFRLFGRMGGAPIWLFLIGVSTSRALPDKLLIGATILVAADTVLLGSPFPTNILVTIIIVRLILDHIMRFVMRDRYVFWLSILLLIFGFMASKIVVEYGTIAILYAMVGYIVRHKDRLFAETFFTIKDYSAFLFTVVMAYTILETAIFGFGEFQTFILLLMTALAMYVMVTMQPMTFDNISAPNVRKALMFCGRKTLEIYVAHLLLFKVVLLMFLTLK